MSAATWPERARDVGGNLDLAVHVAAVDLVGAAGGQHLGHLRQPHDARRAVGVGADGQAQALDVGGDVARARRQPHLDVVVLVVLGAPVAHRVAGHQRAQRCR